MVRDQAELFGLVQRISDLGLTMLSAAQTDEPVRARRADGPFAITWVNRPAPPPRRTTST